MCVSDEDATLGSQTPPSFEFKYPDPGRFKEWWHVLPHEGQGRSFTVNPNTPVFTPAHIKPCIKPRLYGQHCTECDAHIPGASSPVARTNNCINADLPDEFFFHPRPEFEHGPWNVYDAELSRGCLGEQLFSRLFLKCVFSCVQACDNLQCKARLRALERVAPSCEWSQFRTFVLTLLSCRVRRVLGSMRRDFERGPREVDLSTFGAPLSNSVQQSVCHDILGMYDVWWWGFVNEEDTAFMESTGPSPSLLPGYHHRALKTTSECQKALGICPNRMWNASGHGRRRIAEVCYIGAAATSASPICQTREHDDCTDETCVLNHLTSTFAAQAHKCIGGQCEQEYFFDPKTLNDTAAADESLPSDKRRILAWSTSTHHLEAPRLSQHTVNYMAISHVWSDGTGVGIKSAGRVNRCLFDYFKYIAALADCDAIWWDAISIPSDPHLRKLAIASMLRNYEKAKVTLVHDQNIASFAWKEDGSPAVSIILSSWFTRGWTAAELLMSQAHSVKFVFADENHGGPVIKDLDNDILARRDAGRIYTLGHLAANDILCSLRQNRMAQTRAVMSQSRRVMVNGVITSLTQLLSVLHSRTTSWSNDKILIAGLLCLPPEEVEALLRRRTSVQASITRAILNRCKRIRITELIHSGVPQSDSGSWSWCPQSIYDLGQATDRDYDGHAEQMSSVDISEDGSIMIHHIDVYECKTTDIIVPLGRHPALVTRVTSALSQRQDCALVASEDLISLPIPILLLVKIPYIFRDGLVSCQWIGWVYLQNHQEIAVRSSDRNTSPYFGDRGRLGDLDPRYDFDFRALGRSIVIGKDIPPGIGWGSRISFGLAFWVIERMRMSLAILEDKRQTMWCLSDHPLLHEGLFEPSDKFVFSSIFNAIQLRPDSDPIESGHAQWPLQPIRVYPGPETRIRLCRAIDETSPYPTMGVLKFSDEFPESCVSTSFLDTLGFPIETNDCTIQHSFACHGVVRLHWSFLSEKYEHICETPHLNLLDTLCHIVDERHFSGHRSRKMPRANLTIGSSFFSQTIKRQLRQGAFVRDEDVARIFSPVRESKRVCIAVLKECQSCSKCEDMERWRREREVEIESI